MTTGTIFDIKKFAIHDGPEPGYSDYFCDLSKALQDEIIARTEHQTFLFRLYCVRDWVYGGVRVKGVAVFD